MVAVEQIAQFLAEKLTDAGIEIGKLVIFGSYMRGEENPDSDIDFAVISPSFEGKDIYERCKITAMPVAETIWQFDVPIDLIELTPNDMSMQKRLICSYVAQGRIIPVKVRSTTS